MSKQRTLNNVSQDLGSVELVQHNEASGAKKSVSVGPCFINNTGLALNTAQNVNPGQSLYIYNNAGAVGWVSLGINTAVAPTGFANAIPCKPNDWTVISSGLNNTILGSAATLGLYILDDATGLKDV